MGATDGRSHRPIELGFAPELEFELLAALVPAVACALVSSHLPTELQPAEPPELRLAFVRVAPQLRLTHAHGSYGTPSYGTTAPSYGSSYRPYPGSYSRRRLFGGVGLCPVLFLLVLLGGVALLVSRKRAQPFAPSYTPMPYGQPYAPMTPQVALRRVSVGLAAGRRREVQSELEALQARFPNDAYPLAMAARDLLLRTLNDAVYGFVELGERPESEAEGTFTRTADDLRGRYTVERIQNDLRLAELQMQAQREEGEGLVVVSLLVALRGAMPAPPISPDRHGVAAALQSLQCAPHDLLALEIVWSPAQDTDRMSSAELEVVYPELRRLDAQAAYGRVTCGHCAACGVRRRARPVPRACGAPAPRLTPARGRERLRPRAA